MLTGRGSNEEGFFYITDRKKDLIIRGGFNISPREVQEVLMLHPKILEAAVVAGHDSRGEEIVKAFEVPKTPRGRCCGTSCGER